MLAIASTPERARIVFVNCRQTSQELSCSGTKYAVVSTFLARHDNGNQYFSFSRIGSAAGTAFISREWQPRSTTTAGDGAVSFGISMGSDVGFNIVREFWPGLRRHRL